LSNFRNKEVFSIQNSVEFGSNFCGYHKMGRLSTMKW
jgi:hypothetical protein